MGYPGAVCSETAQEAKGASGGERGGQQGARLARARADAESAAREPASGAAPEANETHGPRTAAQGRAASVRKDARKPAPRMAPGDGARMAPSMR